MSRVCRCSADSPDLGSCTAAAETVLELTEGIWSSDAETNPFADYFKVYIHSCSNDDFSGETFRYYVGNRYYFCCEGTRTSSRLTSDLYFHGKHILTSALQDLVASFGINTAERVVLAGSGSGARGVGYNCDYVSEAISSVNPGADTRCLLDSPDLVPWWVRTEAETCRGRDLNTAEREQLLWAKQPDQSCVEAEAARTNSSVSEAAHVCGLFSRYWRHLATPFFLIASQYDPVQFSGAVCGPAPTSPQLPAYQLSWRRGVLALLQAMVAARPGQVGVFSANCDSHLVLAGVLAQPYWTRLAVPRYEAEQEAASLSSLVASWGRGEAAVAVDSLLRNNSACVTAAPHRRHGACMGRLASCAGDTRAQLLPSLARAGHGGWGRGLIRRLAPPSHIWPASFDQHRRCGLDPYYSGCGNVKYTLIVPGQVMLNCSLSQLARAEVWLRRLQPGCGGRHLPRRRRRPRGARVRDPRGRAQGEALAAVLLPPVPQAALQ